MGEGSRILCGEINILLSFGEGPLTWSSTVGNSAASHPWSPQHPYADSECTKVFHLQRCLWDGIIINYAVFQLALK